MRARFWQGLRVLLVTELDLLLVGERDVLDTMRDRSPLPVTAEQEGADDECCEQESRPRGGRPGTL